MATKNSNLENLSINDVKLISERFLMGWHNLEKDYGFRIKSLNNKRRQFGLEEIDKNVSMQYRIAYIKSHYSNDEILNTITDYLRSGRVSDDRWQGIELFDCRFGRDYVTAFRQLIGSSVYRKISEQYRVDKLKETQTKEYGGVGLAGKDAYAKAVNTNISKYGVSNPMQCEEIKDRLCEMNTVKYGGMSPFSSKSVRKKALDKKIDNLHKQIQQYKKDGIISDITFGSVKEEEVFCMLVQRFGKDDVFYQYGLHPYDKRYPYQCDFYIKSLDLFIELNCHYSHHTHWYDPSDHGDALRRTHLLASESKKSKNAAKVWCETDVEKRNTAKSNSLNYLVFWQNDLSDFYAWFNIYNCDVDRFLEKYTGNTY